MTSEQKDTKLIEPSIMICYACGNEINELPYYYALYFKINSNPDKYMVDPKNGSELIEKRIWCKECGK